MILQIIISILAAYIVLKKTKNMLFALLSGSAAWYIISLTQTESFFNVGDPMNPFAHLPRPVAPERCADNGDLELTNLYRRLHNLESIQRSEVFQFNDALAGGSYGIGVEPYVGAAYEREMNAIKAHIRDVIQSRRRGYSEMYDTPTKPVFITNQDDERILGIPTQVGSLPYYY